MKNPSVKSIFSVFRKSPKKSKKEKKSLENLDLYKTYFYDSAKPIWTSRNYSKFADEGYIKNVIAHRCISMIAKNISSVKIKLFENEGDNKYEIKDHPALNILKFPNAATNGNLFKEALFSNRFISGNSYILAVRNSAGVPLELYSLRPDRVSLTTDKSGFVTSYIYKTSDKEIKYPVDKLTGQSNILHLKNFHPLDDHFGLSPIEPAAYSIDQHNQAAQWNQSLLQNGAKPSGALVVRSQSEGGLGVLTDEQYSRIKRQMEEEFSGYNNAGKPLLLEGGLDWKEMSLSPKDMDFISSKQTSSREIALAFGVPPQLLGIPGDNTYSNLAEARLELWEQTILPLTEEYVMALNHWLIPMFKDPKLEFEIDINNIPALLPRRDNLWKRLSDSNFLTDSEKRRFVGLGSEL